MNITLRPGQRRARHRAMKKAYNLRHPFKESPSGGEEVALTSAVAIGPDGSVIVKVFKAHTPRVLGRITKEALAHASKVNQRR